MILALEQGKYKVSLEHLMPENEEVLKDDWRHIKRTDTGLKEFPLDKSIEKSKQIMLVMIYSSLNNN